MTDSLREKIALTLRADNASRRGMPPEMLPPFSTVAPGIGEMYRRQADAALAAIEASGYCICPLEPTEEMVAAGQEVLDSDRIFLDGVAEVIRAALAARPRDISPAEPK